MARISGTALRNRLFGTSAADTINGLGGNDDLFGYAGNDRLNGGDGNDLLVGGAGNDIMTGGSGTDTARFSGNHTAYTVTAITGGFRVVGPDGTDIVRGVEFLKFADIRIATGSNVAPDAQDDIGNTNADTVVSGSVLSNDRDFNAHLLTVSRVNGSPASVGVQITLASGALLTLNANGTYTYDPNGAFAGTPQGTTAIDSFTYQVSDGRGGFDTATAEIRVAGTMLNELGPLTLGVDAIPGTNLNDIIRGGDDTFSAFDNINGGAGTDTLALTELAGTLDTSALAAPNATVTGVEIATFTSVDAINADTRTWTGLQTIVATETGGNDDVTVTTNANATHVTVNGGDDIFIEDISAADTLASVIVNGVAGTEDITVNSTALTSLKVSNTDGFILAGSTGALAIDISNSALGGDDITANSATSLAMTVSGTTSLDDFNAGAATSLTINANAGLTMDDINAISAALLTINGGSSILIGDVDLAINASINASGNSGGVTIQDQIDNDVAFTGGSGNDSVVVGPTSRAIAMGSGDDRVQLNDDAIGATGSLSGGAGSADTLAMSYIDAISATLVSGLENQISEFERLTLLSAASGTINLANLDDINHVTTAAGNVDLDLDNMSSGGTLVMTGANSNRTDVDFAANGANDVFNLSYVSGGGGFRHDVDLEGQSVETVNISTAGASPFSGDLQLDGTATINVSGNAGFNFNLFGSDINDVTLLNAASVTGTGAAGSITATAQTAGVGVTFVGGAGDDTLTGNTGADTLIGNGGSDVLSGLGGSDNLQGGAGTDTLDGGGDETDTLTGGVDADVFVVNDTSPFVNQFDIVTDATVGSGDRFDFIAGIADFENVAIVVGVGDGFSVVVNNAINAVGDLAWFQFGGNTYLVNDQFNNNGGFVAGNDTVVQLLGLKDLSGAMVVGGDLII